MAPDQDNQKQEYLSYLLDGERGSNTEDPKPTLEELSVTEISDLLASLPRPERLELWASIDEKIQGKVLLELPESTRQFIIENTGLEKLLAISRHLDTDDLAELIRFLPVDIGESILSKISKDQQLDVSKVLTYDENQAGSLMNLEYISAHPQDSTKSLIRKLRESKELARNNDIAYVVDDDSILVGILALRELLLVEPKQTIGNVMDDNPITIEAQQSVDEVVRTIRGHDLLAVPVIDENKNLIGQITVDDIVDIIDDKSSKYAINSVGTMTKDEDLFLPVWQSTTQRAWWLGINLITAFMAAYVVNLFGVTIEKAVGLAVLMPIVASMGGIAGSQTMVLVIRGFALDLINRDNFSQLVTKEFLVGLANGILWAVIIAILVVIWMGEAWLGFIIMIAVIINVLVGAFSGVLLPFLLRKLGSDPAISAHVILTTITDVIGLGVFLGSATIYLALF